MRRRIQAVPRGGNGRCVCGTDGGRRAGDGGPGPAVGPGTEAGGGAIQGRFFQTVSSGDGVHVYTVYMDGLLGTESVLWGVPDDTVPDPIVSFSSDTAYVPEMTVTYTAQNYTRYQCSVDGVVYIGNVEA